MKKRTLYFGTLVIASVVVLAAGASALASRDQGHDRVGTSQMPPASQFSARIDNEWFPLKPGTRYVYIGTKDGRPSRDVMTVTHRTRKIQGIPCVVVRDRLYLGGRLHERTTDWYSQDKAGNVWYLGEKTAEFDKQGHVASTSGTWTAGVNGAQAGIYIPGNPRVGQSGRQEYYKGQAEDHFQVLGVFSTVTPPVARNVVLTKEWTPLEPGTIDHKMYARGIGIVLEQAEKGSTERAELVSVTRGG